MDSHESKIDRLVEALRSLPSRDGLMNPYASASGSAAADSRDEIGPEADSLRSENLKRYLLNCLAQGGDVILCGEAPGYQGCRFTGVAFTAEFDIAADVNPALKGLSLLRGAVTGRRTLMKEPSGQAVWQAMRRADKPAITWNAVQLHPHEAGASLTNRTPTREEVELGSETLSMLIDLVRPRLVVAVGKTAERALANLGVDASPLRHPAYGGKPEFLQGLQDLGIIRPPEPDPQQSLFG